MSDRDALYAAVCADPWNDLPRLILADWLDDHGEPDRAAFIRSEVELAREWGFGRRAPEAVWTARSRGINRFAGHPVAPAGLAGVAFTGHHDRGLPAGVLVQTAGALVDHAGAIRRTVPLTGVQLAGRSKRRAAGFEAFAACPLLAQVRAINLYRVPVGDAGAEALARSPHLHGLRRLDLRHTGLTDAGIRTLIAAPWFRTLQQLDVDANPFTAAGVEALLDCGTDCDLVHFRLTNWRELFGEIVAPARAMWDANHARLAAEGRVYFDG